MEPYAGVGKMYAGSTVTHGVELGRRSRLPSLEHSSDMKTGTTWLYTAKLICAVHKVCYIDYNCHTVTNMRTRIDMLCKRYGTVELHR